jgi:hypothetical protein
MQLTARFAACICSSTLGDGDHLDPSKRIFMQIPLSQIWDDDGPIRAGRERLLSLHELTAMLSHYPVEFVVANPGQPLKWISVDKCIDFWKSEVKSHLVSNPNGEFSVEDFPNEYAYIASEWSGKLQTPVVLLEKYH